jgi:PPOX class probable FMN-dependent enzyme
MESRNSNFDNRFTQSFGFPAEKIQTKISSHLPEKVKAFIKESPFLVMATADPEGHCDASPKGGAPGFVRILDDRHLLVPDIEGNKLFQSYLNMDANPHVGLLFFIPGVPEAVRVNGVARIVDRTELLAMTGNGVASPSTERGLLQGIVIEVEEAYGHCPRAMSYSDLWNTDRIEDRKLHGAQRR